MKRADVMKTLAGLAKPSYQKILPNHGVHGPAYGVSYAELGKLKKRLSPDTDLARELWGTGNHDARVLATMIADPQVITSRECDQWIRDVDNYVLCDAVSGLVGRSPHAAAKAKAWRKVKGEWKSAAGWTVVSHLAAPGADVDVEWLGELLPEIEAGIADAPNRTRHAMNQALISIGGYHADLRASAVASAKRIGTVEVDHGKTSCKTPAAGPYIAKMVAHAAKQGAPRRSR